MPWSFIKFSQLIHEGNVWRSVCRLCMWILGFKVLNYSTSIQQILRSVLGSFAPLQKLRRNHRCYERTEALSGMVFVPSQKLSGIVWTWLHQRECKQRLNVRHTFSCICLPSLHMEDKGANDDLSFFRTSLGPGSAVGRKCRKRSETALKKSASEASWAVDWGRRHLTSLRKRPESEFMSPGSAALSPSPVHPSILSPSPLPIQYNVDRGYTKGFTVSTLSVGWEEGLGGCSLAAARACNYVSLWNLNSTSNSPEAPCRLSC